MIDVNMNNTATIVVTLFKNVNAPDVPKIVWLEPPKAAPISAPLLFLQQDDEDDGQTDQNVQTSILRCTLFFGVSLFKN